jgi:hypothetical protein
MLPPSHRAFRLIRTIRVIPKIRLRHPLLNGLDSRLKFGDVKETPGAAKVSVR